jgi:hypothetical protein
MGMADEATGANTPSTGMERGRAFLPGLWQEEDLCRPERTSEPHLHLRSRPEARAGTWRTTISVLRRADLNPVVNQRQLFAAELPIMISPGLELKESARVGIAGDNSGAVLTASQDSLITG